MLAAGRQPADGLKAELTPLVVGHKVNDLLNTLVPADKAICVDGPALAEFNPESHLAAVTGVLFGHTPRVVLFSRTATGTDPACRVARRLGWPVAVSCRELSVSGSDLVYTAPTCGGKILAEGSLPGPSCVATVMSGGYNGCPSGHGIHRQSLRSFSAAGGREPLRDGAGGEQR